jgi:membrane fusion protein (multidrug efflux system)
VALAVAGAVGCGASEAPRGSGGPPAAIVEIVTVQPTALRDAVDFAGQLDADESVTLRPETSGIVEDIEFTEGQDVTRGQVLFRLRDDEQRARLHAAKAALVLAQRNYERAEALRKEGVLALEDYDRARAEFERAQAAVEVAQVALDRTVIRAPFDGVVGRRYVSPGDHVRGGGGTGSDGTGLAAVDAVATLQLIFSVPERAIPRTQPGMPLEVSVAPYPGQRFAGKVDFVAPTVDPSNRRMIVKARIPNPDRKLRPGLSATVHLELGYRPDAIVVPESALVYDAGGSFVWRVTDDQTAARVPVEIGLRQDGQVEILSGLAAGDRIVSAGTNKVAPGRPVRAGKTATAGAAPTPRTES